MSAAERTTRDTRIQSKRRPPIIKPRIGNVCTPQSSKDKARKNMRRETFLKPNSESRTPSDRILRDTNSRHRIPEASCSKVGYRLPHLTNAVAAFDFRRPVSQCYYEYVILG